MGVGTFVADLILPPVCLSCRSLVASHATLCPACWSQVDFITPPLCDRLGIPLPYDPGGTTISLAASANPPTYDRARAVAAYSGVMRQLIHGFKYRDGQEGLELFGRWLCGAGRELLADADLLVSVPLYWLRLWGRRFNQAALLSSVVSRQSGVPFDHFVLQRVRRTKTQIGMTASQRRRNVRGAFRVSSKGKRLIEGRNIILIDDVVTTGATVEACATALRRAGAGRVDVLALARVTNPSALII